MTRRVTQYSRARRDEPPGSDRGGDTERPGDEPLRRVRESAAAAAAAHGLFSQQQRGWWWWWWRVNEASIDSSSFLEVDFFINAFTTTTFVRSFIFLSLSLSLSF